MWLDWGNRWWLWTVNIDQTVCRWDVPKQGGCLDSFSEDGSSDTLLALSIGFVYVNISWEGGAGGAVIYSPKGAIGLRCHPQWQSSPLPIPGFNSNSDLTFANSFNCSWTQSRFFLELAKLLTFHEWDPMIQGWLWLNMVDEHEEGPLNI